ncbi:MAG: right-handed parallel beta-helix repeat-containing protein, partial [Thermoplasmata archaeon]|nr:right-handed parallel beta-helix repeat-containing protein [Thermoplasmata archaeon]
GGFSLESGSDNNRFTNNTVIKNPGYGFYLSLSNNNNISNNNIDNNGHINWSSTSEFCGIKIGSSHDNTISGNSITRNAGCRISAYRSANNLIIFNKIYSNPSGISISTNEVSNKIYLNEFINNTKNAGDMSSYNLWNSTEPLSYVYNGENYTKYLGNYWDDYSGKDSNSDGIGDTPYNISHTPINRDYFPLVSLIDNYTLIPSTTKIKLVEVCSNSTNVTVSLLIQRATLNSSITGILNGTVNVTELEMIIINSSSFAGFGFFKSTWRAVIEGKVYEGTWQGMLFNKSGERKIYLKGTVFGGLRGLTDGYLIESKSGSGIYDVYNSTWTLNHLGPDLTFA